MEKTLKIHSLKNIIQQNLLALGFKIMKSAQNKSDINEFYHLHFYIYFK